jgi:hypothetical protein
MTIHQKISFRYNALFLLNWNQYCQLVDLNRMVLAPYYWDRLKEQGKIVAEAERFKAIFGKSRYEYENNI